jgi:hypothetical protein
MLASLCATSQCDRARSNGNNGTDGGEPEYVPLPESTGTGCVVEPLPLPALARVRRCIAAPRFRGCLAVVLLGACLVRKHMLKTEFRSEHSLCCRSPSLLVHSSLSSLCAARMYQVFGALYAATFAVVAIQFGRVACKHRPCYYPAFPSLCCALAPFVRCWFCRCAERDRLRSWPSSSDAWPVSRCSSLPLLLSMFRVILVARLMRLCLLRFLN